VGANELTAIGCKLVLSALLVGKRLAFIRTKTFVALYECGHDPT
jgi:hypothetical protein